MRKQLPGGFARLILLLLTVTCVLAQQRPLRERLLESAQKGDAEAQFELGKNYETGRIGLPKDLVQAEHWYRLAADQGDPFAEASLALLYQFGKGVRQDSLQALMWYEVAIARSTGGDRASIAELRDDLIAGMTPAQIAEARRLAREFRPRDNKSKQ
jgi:TPR repeat protein